MVCECRKGGQDFYKIYKKEADKLLQLLFYLNKFSL